MAKQPVQKTVKTFNYGINRLKRIQKHLKKHPNDRQATVALNENKTESNRKASEHKLGWMSSNKDIETTLRSKFVGTITKEAVGIHARILKFSKKSPFRLIPTLVKTNEGLVFKSKHLSKLSNFKKVA